MLLLFLIAVTAAACVAVLVVRRYLAVVRVHGGSMSPALEDGERVLVRRRPARVRAGDIVVFPVPGQIRVERRQLIKRVAAVPGDAIPACVLAAVRGLPGEHVPTGKLVVLGDARESTDSRAWGYLHRADVNGTVIRKIPSR